MQMRAANGAVLISNYEYWKRIPAILHIKPKTAYSAFPYIAWPPDTFITWPVIIQACSPDRNKTAAAMSSG